MRYAIEIWFPHSSTNVSLGSQSMSHSGLKSPRGSSSSAHGEAVQRRKIPHCHNIEARQGTFGFSAEFCLTNSQARVSLMLVSLPGSARGPEGDSDAPTVITELPRPPGKNSKHQSALIFAGSPVTSMQFQRDQNPSVREIQLEKQPFAHRRFPPLPFSFQRQVPSAIHSTKFFYLKE